MTDYERSRRLQCQQLRVPYTNDRELEDIAEMLGDSNVEAAAEMTHLVDDLAATPLARAYRRMKLATTGKQLRNARSAVRRATRQQMVKTMVANSDALARRPAIAMAIAASVVRAQMSTNG